MSRAGDRPTGGQAAAAPTGRWLTPRSTQLAMLAAAQLAVVIVFYESFASMVAIWMRSETYHHGLLIYPLSAYLVWLRWPVLSTVPIRPAPAGLAGLAALSVAWWLCGVIGVQVGQHFAIVAMTPLLVLTVAGLRFARTIAFPLAYLAFAVPFGEIAIPYLIDFTAFFTVEALQICGFPVLRDGVYFSIPAGDFEVAKACSGIRYLLASLALGTLYGYLAYRSLWKRGVFVLFALVLPIVANGLRAFGIVLLAHYSDMKIAVGVDHLVYGWIFFGLIMLAMFWIGDRYRDRSITERNGDELGAARQERPSASGRKVLIACLLSVSAAAVGPVAQATLSRAAPLVPPGLPVSAGDWQVLAAAPVDWSPSYVGATHELARDYARDESRLAAAVLRYDGASQNAELASAANLVADPGTWQIGRPEPRLAASVDGRSLPVRERVIRAPGVTRLVWSWNEVDGTPVEGMVETKWRELLVSLAGRRPKSVAFVLSTRVDERDPERARSLLADFLNSAGQSLRRCAPDPHPELCVSPAADADREVR